MGSTESTPRYSSLYQNNIIPNHGARSPKFASQEQRLKTYKEFFMAHRIILETGQVIGNRILLSRYVDNFHFT